MSLSLLAGTTVYLCSKNESNAAQSDDNIKCDGMHLKHHQKCAKCKGIQVSLLYKISALILSDISTPDPLLLPHIFNH